MGLFIKLFPVLFVILLVSYFSFNSKLFLPQKPVVNSEEKVIAKNVPAKKSEKLKDEPKFPYPTIESVFSEDHSWVATVSAERKAVLVATGDVIPARVVNINANKYNDFTWPYLKTSELTKNSDITFINLETPLIRNCPFSNEGFKFCGDYRNIEGLEFAGVDIASLANNHASNYGNLAVEETHQYLEEVGIAATGRSGPVYKEVKGTKFAFLGYNDIGFTPTSLSPAEEEKISNDIAVARRDADIVVVTYHWGTEYQSQPDERQKYLGRFTIDSGADLVIGNHPHWIQPIEFYKGKLITYAHGNFVFDQMWSQKTREGVVGKYTFFDKQLIDVEYTPVLISDYGQPNLIDDLTYKRKIIEDMQQESIKLSEIVN